MAIVDLFEQEETIQKAASGKSSLFSTLVTRFCFFLLLIADLAWFVLSVILLTLTGALYLTTLGKVNAMRKFWLHCRRTIVCAIALIVGIFCPPFGIMIGCTYFLMYDKPGMERIVPASLQAQFKDLFQDHEL